jgi:hypothetical protein
VTAYPCPYCRTRANLTTGCPGCGRAPDPDAAEVVRLDAEIPGLTARAAAARDALSAAEAALRQAWQRREAAVARVRAAMAPPPVKAATPTPTPVRSKEASTKLVQNVLFLLGGLLLAVAAIVFTAVAWSQFGVVGRAAILAGFTVAALAAPLGALRRGLAATAETFAAVGLLLVLLDGYAAWYVNLFGVADYSALGYAGAVCAVTAAVAAGYEHVTGLVGPRFVALIVAQPVLPLLAAPFHPNASGWAFTLAGVAVLDLAVIHLRRSALSPLGVTAYLLGGLAVGAAGLAAFDAVLVARSTGSVAVAALALVTPALVLVAAAVLARQAVAQSVAGGLLVVAVAIAATRFAAAVAGIFLTPVVVAVVFVVLAAAVRAVPRRVRRGPWIAALVVTAAPVLIAVAGTVLAAATADSDWRLPAVIALLTAALTILLPRATHLHAVLGGAALLAVASPAAFGLSWWTAPILNLTVTAAALALALTRSRTLWPAGVAGVLTLHALEVAFAQPNVAAATLTAVATLGLGTALLDRRGPRALGGVALTVGLLAVPAAAWQTAAALSLSAPVQSRIALAAAALLVGARQLVVRRVAGYGPFALAAALIAVGTVPGWAYGSGDSPAIYAAIGLLLVALTASATVWSAFAALPVGLTLLVTTVPSVLAVLDQPVGVWGGRPPGTGVGPVAVSHVVALAIFAAAVAVGAYFLRGRRAVGWAVAPVVVPVVPMALAAARVPWPGVPAASLFLGLAALLAAVLLPTPRPMITLPEAESGLPAGPQPVAGSRVPAVLVAALLAGAGSAGALTTYATTLVALGAILLAGAMAGVAARDLPARVAGWLAVSGSALGFGYTIGQAVGLPMGATAYLVLVAAALCLALGTFLKEGLPVRAAAHAGAFLSLLLASGSLRRCAAICTLWGLALGLRALRPGASATVRRTHVIAAAAAELAGWWLLIASARVATIEAYTLPLAGVVVLAGWLVRRSRRDLSSWLAYGPALAAALLPSLASVLVGEGEPARRLLLGVAALAVLLAGAHARLQAPVVAGGITLALTAVHEVALVWDLLPRWIPLALAGFLLVGLAMTLERRRRDLARMRAGLARMS